MCGNWRLARSQRPFTPRYIFPQTGHAGSGKTKSTLAASYLPKRGSILIQSGGLGDLKGVGYPKLCLGRFGIQPDQVVYLSAANLPLHGAASSKMGMFKLYYELEKNYLIVMECL